MELQLRHQETNTLTRLVTQTHGWNCPPTKLRARSPPTPPPPPQRA
eukprot:COSAG04_NODE_18498_length_440_cov_0.756598_2_plen_45_part_01